MAQRSAEDRVDLLLQLGLGVRLAQQDTLFNGLLESSPALRGRPLLHLAQGAVDNIEA